LKDFHEFIDTLVSLTANLHTAHVTFEFWKRYLEVQLVKFSMHSASLAYLLKGTPIKDIETNKEFKYPDLGSIFLLRRAQIENYLMFYYLNIQPSTNEEGIFRYLLYELSGLSHRQTIPAIQPDTIQKKENERKEIENIIKEIKKNKIYQALPLKNQNQLLKTRPARIMGWEKLIQSSGLNTEQFLTSWKLCSNYSHSEMIGSIQIESSIKNPDELKWVLFLALEQSIITTCILIKDMTKLFKSTEITYNALPVSLTTKIDMWCKVGTGLKQKNINHT
jgi:hypothetical protein